MKTKPKQKLMKISEVKVDDKLYPRTHVDFVTGARYYNALKAGENFPPIAVAKRDNGKCILIDGAHRLQASKQCGQTHIQAEVFEGLTDKEIYVKAIEMNVTHGRQFGTNEITTIAITLQDWKMSLEDISKIIKIPADKIIPFVAKRMTRISETGQEFALKRPLQMLAGSDVSQTEGVELTQQRLGGTAQIRIVDTLNTLLKNNWIEDSEVLHAKLKRLNKLTDKYNPVKDKNDVKDKKDKKDK